MYHLELRQFPHNLCRFNLDEHALGEIVGPWTRETSLKIEDQEWLPQKAKLKILEGPQIPLNELTMGRGWRAAERQGKDVTKRVLAAARQAAAPPTVRPGSQPDNGVLADSLGLELLALLASGPVGLSRAWRAAGERFPERSPSECLALAEAAVRSLLKARLIALVQADGLDGRGEGASDGGDSEVREGLVEQVLRSLESWTGHGEPDGVRMRRV